jgi:diacylglycerol O-acyltransferase
MSDMRFDRAMSDAEGLMWRLEKDPHLSSIIGTVSVLDRAPDFEAFRRRLERATIAVPRLRQRVAPQPANISPPIWVDDPDFDIDLHVRRIACPKPGSLRQVLDICSVILADPFERTRPLWQFVVIEGMRGGKAAVLQKMHHTITDGERGVELSLQYLDFERDAPEPPPLDDQSDPLDDEAHQPTGNAVREFIAGGIRMPLGLARQVRELLADPASIPAASGAAIKTVRGVVTQLSDTDAARSPLWTQRSLHRRIEVLRVPFRETKDAAKRLGGTLNTAFITSAAQAAGDYHRRMGVPVDHLRTTMAISTRTESSGGNAFSLARLLVPTGDMPIAERFQLILEASAAAKTVSKEAGGLDSLAAFASTLPTSLITRLARQQSQTIDFATSNVKASPVPCYIAGAQILEIYPVGPLAGVAFNMTLISYVGSLDIGVNIDTAAVLQPDLLIECLNTAFKDLAAS